MEDLEDNYFQELVQLDLKLGWICFCVFGVEVEIHHFHHLVTWWLWWGLFLAKCAKEVEEKPHL